MELLLEKVNVMFTTKYRKLQQLIIQYKGKAIEISRQVIVSTICDSHGVRFGVKIEK